MVTHSNLLNQLHEATPACKGDPATANTAAAVPSCWKHIQAGRSPPPATPVFPPPSTTSFAPLRSKPFLPNDPTAKKPDDLFKTLLCSPLYKCKRNNSSRAGGRHPLTQTGYAPLEQHSWSSTAGAAQLERHSWSGTAGAAQLEQHSWSSTAGAAPLEQHSWSSTAGVAPLTPSFQRSFAAPPANLTPAAAGRGGHVPFPKLREPRKQLRTEPCSTRRSPDTSSALGQVGEPATAAENRGQRLSQGNTSLFGVVRWAYGDYEKPAET